MDSYRLPPSAGGPTIGYGFVPSRGAITLAVVVAVIVYFLWRVRDILPPFVIAFFLAALLDPLVTKLQRKGVPRIRAVLTIYILVFLSVLFAVIHIVPATLGQLNSLSTGLGDDVQKLTVTWNEFYTEHQSRLKYVLPQNPLQLHTESSPNFVGPPDQAKPAPDQAKPAQDKSGLIQSVTSRALDAVKGAVTGFLSRVIWFVIIPLALFYFLMDFQALRARLIALAPVESQAYINSISQEIVEIFSAYMRSLAIVCILYGFAATLLFYTLGLRYALFVGVAAGVLYAVPYLGPAIAMGSAGGIALTTHPAVLGMTGIAVSPLVYACVVVGMLVGMQMLFDYGITPRMVGGSVGLHPIINIFALMCGAALFGVVGMLLAVPVAASVQRILIYFFPKLAAPLPHPVPPETPAELLTPDEAVTQVV